MEIKTLGQLISYGIEDGLSSQTIKEQILEPIFKAKRGSTKRKAIKTAMQNLKNFADSILKDMQKINYNF
jgi:hypothetical protein